MNMMEENNDGKMEFPRDVMLEDCFSGAQEPLYGFITNVTIPEEMIKPCLIDIECFENGTSISTTGSIQGGIVDTIPVDSDTLPQNSVKRQGMNKYAIGTHNYK